MWTRLMGEFIASKNEPLGEWVSQAEDDIKQRKGEYNVAMLSLGRRLGTTVSQHGQEC